MLIKVKPEKCPLLVNQFPYKKQPVKNKQVKYGSNKYIHKNKGLAACKKVTNIHHGNEGYSNKQMNNGFAAFTDNVCRQEHPCQSEG